MIKYKLVTVYLTPAAVEEADLEMVHVHFKGSRAEFLGLFLESALNQLRVTRQVRDLVPTPPATILSGVGDLPGIGEEGAINVTG